MSEDQQDLGGASWYSYSGESAPTPFGIFLGSGFELNEEDSVATFPLSINNTAESLLLLVNAASKIGKSKFLLLIPTRRTMLFQEFVITQSSIRSQPTPTRNFLSEFAIPAPAAQARLALAKKGVGVGGLLYTCMRLDTHTR